MLPKNGELRGGERWDRLSAAWVPADEWQRRQWSREDAAFARKANQGQLCAPRFFTDTQGGIRGIRSMKDGRMYDSKSQMRKHYRESGVLEVGDDSSVTNRDKITGPRQRYEDPKQEQKIDAALGRAWSRVGLPA
jgi:hypothetical protein